MTRLIKEIERHARAGNIRLFSLLSGIDYHLKHKHLRWKGKLIHENTR